MTRIRFAFICMLISCGPPNIALDFNELPIEFETVDFVRRGFVVIEKYHYDMPTAYSISQDSALVRLDTMRFRASVYAMVDYTRTSWIENITLYPSDLESEMLLNSRFVEDTTLLARGDVALRICKLSNRQFDIEIVGEQMSDHSDAVQEVHPTDSTEALLFRVFLPKRDYTLLGLHSSELGSNVLYKQSDSGNRVKIFESRQYGFSPWIKRDSISVCMARDRQYPWNDTCVSFALSDIDAGE